MKCILKSIKNLLLVVIFSNNEVWFYIILVKLNGFYLYSIYFRE